MGGYYLHDIIIAGTLNLFLQIHGCQGRASATISSSKAFYSTTQRTLSQSIKNRFLYHAKLGLLDKGRAIKGLVVCNNWDLKP